MLTVIFFYKHVMKLFCFLNGNSFLKPSTFILYLDLNIKE